LKNLFIASLVFFVLVTSCTARILLLRLRTIIPYPHLRAHSQRQRSPKKRVSSSHNSLWIRSAYQRINLNSALTVVLLCYLLGWEYEWHEEATGDSPRTASPVLGAEKTRAGALDSFWVRARHSKTHESYVELIEGQQTSFLSRANRQTMNQSR